MLILLCPDKYKGSLDGPELVAAMKMGGLLANAEIEIESIPLADGGDGTEEILGRQLGGITHEVQVENALGEPVTSQFTMLGDGHTAIIEMAKASGLAMLDSRNLDPLQADTYGTGQLMMAAVDAGATRLIICIGGSATTDGGSGMARALGYQLLDENGNPSGRGGAGLTQLARIIPPDPHPLAGVTVEVACDVTNPLLGSMGAAQVYAPQKGATPQEVLQLEAGLSHLALLWEREGHHVAEQAGSGAAGGLGAGLRVFARAALKSGIELVMRELNFEEAVKRADLLVTGEGRLDGQTMSGKVIQGVCEVAGRYEKPVAALCGSVSLSPAQQEKLGLTYAASVVSGPMDLEDSMAQAKDLVMQSAFSLIRLFSLANPA